MPNKNDGGPAFPLQGKIVKQYQPTGLVTGESLQGYQPGMSLRDYFAAKAMQGLVSVHNSYGEWTGCGDMEMNKNMAGTAYAIADAMLKAREE